MDHSLNSYLRRQSTMVLELLLRDYEMQTVEDSLGIAEIIRSILNERKENSNEPPLL